MKLHLKLELLTVQRYGGPGSIVMFSKNTILELDEEIIKNWLTSRLYRIQIGEMFFVIKEIVLSEDGEMQGYSHQHLSPQASSEEYSKLVQDEWNPNTKDGTAIRSFGHKNFFPDKFK